MKETRTLAAILAVVPLWASCSAAAAPACTGDPYMRFRAAAEKATEVKALLALLAANTRKLYEEKGPATGFTLAALKQASDKKDAKVTGATLADGRCMVDVTAVDAAGKQRKGIYMFEAEDGEWKLLSFGWPE